MEIESCRAKASGQEYFMYPLRACYFSSFAGIGGCTTVLFLPIFAHFVQEPMVLWIDREACYVYILLNACSIFIIKFFFSDSMQCKTFLSLG